MRFIGRPGRQRPWWLAVGMLTFVLLFTIVSAAPADSKDENEIQPASPGPREPSPRTTVSEIRSASPEAWEPRSQSGVSEIQPASDSDGELERVPSKERADSFEHHSGDHISQEINFKGGRASPPSSHFTFPRTRTPAANEVPVTYRSPRVSRWERVNFKLKKPEITRLLSWRTFTEKLKKINLRLQERRRRNAKNRISRAKERRVARLLSQPGEQPAVVRHQLTLEELTNLKREKAEAPAAAEAEERRRATVQEVEAAVRAPPAPPTRQLETTGGSIQLLERPAISAAPVEGSSGEAAHSVGVKLSSNPASDWDAVARKAKARVEQGAAEITDSLHRGDLPKQIIGIGRQISLRKRSGVSTSKGGNDASHVDEHAEAVEASRGAVGSDGVASLPGQDGARALPRLWRRGGGSSKDKYSKLESSSEVHLYPGQLITITHEEPDPNSGSKHPSFRFHILNEARDGIEGSYWWSELSKSVQTGLEKKATNLPRVAVSRMSKAEAEEQGIKIASKQADVNQAYEHPLYPPGNIMVSREKGKIVVKMPDGKKMAFNKVPHPWARWLQSREDQSVLLSEAAGKDLSKIIQSAPRPLWKRAVDTDDNNDHRVQRRVDRSTSFHLDERAEAVQASRGAAGSEGVASLPDEAGSRQLPRLQKRLGNLFGKRKPYKYLGSSSTRSSGVIPSSGGDQVEPDLAVLAEYSYPGKAIAIMRLEGEGPDTYRFSEINEERTGIYQTYTWSNLPLKLKEALVGDIPHLRTVVESGLSAAEAERQQIRLASLTSASNTYQHPLYPAETIAISRNGRGQIVFKGRRGQYVSFKGLDKHLQKHMENNSHISTLLDEAIREARMPRRVRKRAVDAGDGKDHQVQKRAGSSSASWAGPSEGPESTVLEYPGEEDQHLQDTIDYFKRKPLSRGPYKDFIP